MAGETQINALVVAIRGGTVGQEIVAMVPDVEQMELAFTLANGAVLRVPIANVLKALYEHGDGGRA